MATEAEVIRCARAYLDGHPFDDPIVDSLGSDSAGLSPMLVQAATGDARVADAEALAARARAQGVDVQLELYPVDAHAFQLFWSFLPEAADAFAAAGEFHSGDRRRLGSVPQLRAALTQELTAETRVVPGHAWVDASELSTTERSRRSRSWVRRRTGRSLARALLREEALGSVLRFPDIEIHRAPARVVDGEDLGPQPGHALNVSRAFSAMETTRARSKSSSYWKVTLTPIIVISRLA